MTLLAAKLFLSPLCVVAVSLAGRRWGMAVAGLLGGLPVVAGPILLIVTLDHGRDFGADAAAGTLLGLAALTAFVVVYGRVAATAGPVPSVLCGWAAFLLGVAILSPLEPPPAASLILVAACFALGLRLLPSPPPPPAAAVPPWWDLPARGLAAMTLVLLLTGVSGALGPHLSGLLAPFPVIASVLAVFTHTHGGVAQLDVLLRNFQRGFYGFAAFCFTLTLALSGLSTAAAFGLATAVAIAVQATTFLAIREDAWMPQPRNSKKRTERGDYGWVISFGCKSAGQLRRLKVDTDPSTDTSPIEVPCPCGETHRVTVSPYRRRRTADEPFDLEVVSLDELR